MEIYNWLIKRHVSALFGHHQAYKEMMLIKVHSFAIPMGSHGLHQIQLYDIYLLLCVQYQTPDDGQETCPKHVELYSKNKFEKLVHLVGFIIRIYHDARSTERQILPNLSPIKSPLCAI